MSAKIITDISAVKPAVQGRFYDLIVDHNITIPAGSITPPAFAVGVTGSVLYSSGTGNAFSTTPIVASVKFSTDANQTALSNYAGPETDTALPLTNGTQTGQLTARTTRIGDMAFLELRGFTDYPTAAIPATVAIPTNVRPAFQVSGTIPFYNSGSTTPGWSALVIVQTNGIIKLQTSLAADIAIDTGFTYYTGIQTGPSNYDRCTICYKL